jgi:class 3 adenylate cyclase
MSACPACDEQNTEAARFCSACGRALGETTAREERKVVSVLFVDLVGFTGTSDQADPEDVRALLRPYHAQLKTEIERYGGTVEKFIGDAVMAVFGAPTSHEDDAERAVRTGLRILDALPSELTVRAAVNTGEALVALDARPETGEGLVAGDVVNVASRLQGAAPPGGLVVGEGTYRATRRAIEYEELDPVTVKGKPEPIQLWRAVAARSRLGIDLDADSRSPFIGRQNELAQLKQTFARVQRESSAQLVTVVGEPGAGKSRLVGELRGFIDDSPDLVYWRQGRCLPYGEGITFWALGEIVKAQAGILYSDTPDEAAAKLEAALEGQPDREWLLARLAPLAGLPGDTAAGQQESFTAWQRFLESLAATRPLVVVFEDLHWADAALLDFLEHLVDWGSDVPLLIVCVTRPELYERRPGWGGGKRNATTISPPPLTTEETERLLDALLPSVLPAETRAALLARCEGNPLFAEEFARLAVEQTSAAVPDTVNALIAARLDTLDADRKALVQDASVLGKVFWAGAVAAMGGRDRDQVVSALRDLVRRDLIRPARVSSVEGEDEFSFWHGLVRDVAYSQIPRKDRAQKHRAFAGWIEGVAGGRLADHAEILAHHYGEALTYARASGEPDDAELIASLRRVLVLAGDRTYRFDPNAAADLYSRALELFEAYDRERAPILVKLGRSLTGIGGRFADAIDRLESARALYRSAGDRPGLGLSTADLSHTMWLSGDRAASDALLNEAVELLADEPPGEATARLYGRVAGGHMVASRPRECFEASELALAHARAAGLEEREVAALQYRGMARFDLGDAGGVDDLRESFRRAIEGGYSQVAATAHSNLGDVVWFLEGSAAGLDYYRREVEFCRIRGLGTGQTWARGAMAAMLYELGEWDEVLRAASEVAEQERGHGDSLAGTLAPPHQALVLARRGRLDEARAALEDILPRVRRAEDPQVLAPALRAAAVVAWLGGDQAGSLEWLDELERTTRGRSPTLRTLDIPDALRICAATGELELAHRLLEGAASPSERNRLAFATADAILAEHAGELERAATLYRELAEGWGAHGHVVERAEALQGAARCAGDDHALDAARQLLAAR